MRNLITAFKLMNKRKVSTYDPDQSSPAWFVNYKFSQAVKDSDLPAALRIAHTGKVKDLKLIDAGILMDCELIKYVKSYSFIETLVKYKI